MVSQIKPGLKTNWWFARRERWSLTWRGWLALLGLALLFSWALVHWMPPFLAPTQRLKTKILVVEGWIPQYALQQAMKEFHTGGYEIIYVTGGPVVGTGGYINDYNTSASVGRELLVGYGLPTNLVVMTPSHISGRDRTYNAALALRAWFRAHQIATTNFNVLTEDVHARRTQLLFQKAFGREVRVGIIATENPDYEPAHWWRYSEGVRQILGESIAYLYAKFIFQPE